MTCRVCRRPDCLPLWPNVEGAGGHWWGCRACGSQSHDIDPDTVVGDYLTADYRDHLNTGGHDPTPAALRTNVELFAAHRRKRDRGNDFLDVGFLNGAGLTAMASAGWSVHGFDVNPTACLGPHTTIAPAFAASLFPRRYDAVLCREVVEHVDDWRTLFAELRAVTKPGGLLQVQTPRPTAFPAGIVHQRHHLQIFAPATLKVSGFAVLERRDWDVGQVVIMR